MSNQDLLGFSQRIGKTLAGLHELRGDSLPVFAIEHGLDREELSDLLASTRAALRRASLRDLLNDASYLSMIIVATEIGYSYQGIGTEYWPRLESALDTELEEDDREMIAARFLEAHQVFGVKRPPDTPLNRLYRRIAWPVTNALAPKEIHRPLAGALQTILASGGQALDAEALVEGLRETASGMWSRRLESWLQDTSTAAELCRRLLDDHFEGGWLSSGIVMRIARDLRSDPEARKRLDEARAQGRRPASGKRSLSLPSARYVMYLADDRPVHLLLKGPVLPAALRREIIDAMQLPVDRLQFAGTERMIELDRFLAGDVVDLQRPKERPPDPAIVRPDGSASPTQTAERLLRELQPPTAERFAITQDPTQAISADETELATTERTITLQWLQSEDVPLGDGDLADNWPSVRYSIQERTLRELDYVPLAGLVMSFGLEGSAKVFADCFPIVVGPLKAEALFLQSDSATFQVETSPGDCVMIEAAPGAYRVEERGERTGSFQLVLPERTEASCASVRFEPEQPSKDAFLAGEFTLRISAPVPLEDVGLHLEIRDARGRRCEEYHTIARLPARLLGLSPIFKGLRDWLGGESADPFGPASLSVQASGIGATTVELEPREREFTFDLDTKSWTSDDGVHASMLATGHAPLVQPAGLQTERSAASIELFLPEIAEDTYLSQGLCVSRPGSFRLGDLAEPPIPKLLREATSRANGVGLVPVIEALVAWRLAAAASGLAEFQRRSVECAVENWVVEQLCGTAWATAEAALELDAISPHAALGRVLLKLRDEGHVDLPRIAKREDDRLIRSLMENGFRQAVPRLVDALEASSSGQEQSSQEIHERLDIAVSEAHERFLRSPHRTPASDFDEPDFTMELDAWRAALRSALAAGRLPGFRKFIMPKQRWQVLASADFGAMSDDGLVGLLDGCHLDARRQRGRRWIDRGDLRAMLQLWLDPRSLLTEPDWRDRVSRFLSDRPTARSARYVALRRKFAYDHAVSVNISP